MELAIEAASDDTGLALSVGGVVALMATWVSHQNQSKELLPHVDRLLQEAGRDKHDIEAVFVDIGPGGYASLRVGVSVAKALAHGLGVPIIGVGRLEVDAWSVAGEARDRRIVAVHRAGRGEVAWAAYQRRERGDWQELVAPRLVKLPEFAEALQRGDAVTGDLDDAVTAIVQERGVSAASANQHRVVALAALAQARRADNRTDDPTRLVPLYLRAPAIGPQQAR